MLKTEIKKVLYRFLQDGISSDEAAQQVLDLFDVGRSLLTRSLYLLEEIDFNHSADAITFPDEQINEIRDLIKEIKKKNK